jgi:hypothetical protein
MLKGLFESVGRLRWKSPKLNTERVNDSLPARADHTLIVHQIGLVTNQQLVDVFSVPVNLMQPLLDIVGRIQQSRRKQPANAVGATVVN